jgi:hypothetical protein
MYTLQVHEVGNFLFLETVSDASILIVNLAPGWWCLSSVGSSEVLGSWTSIQDKPMAGVHFHPLLFFFFFNVQWQKLWETGAWSFFCYRKYKSGSRDFGIKLMRVFLLSSVEDYVFSYAAQTRCYLLTLCAWLVMDSTADPAVHLMWGERQLFLSFLFLPNEA